MRSRATLLLLAALILGGCIIFGWPSSEKSSLSTTTQSIQPSTVHEQPHSPLAVDTEIESVTSSAIDLPAIFDGSEIPGGIRLDQKGNVIVDFQLKLTFDYFMQMLGIDGYDALEIHRLVKQYLEQKLEGAALAYALDVFDRYWEYSVNYNSTQDEEALRQMKDTFHGDYQGDHIAAIEAFRKERDSSRNHFFSQEEMRGLFSREHEYEQYMDKRMAIANGGMEATEKWLKLNELESLLPEKESKARKQMSLVERYKKYQEIQSNSDLKSMALDEQLFDEQELKTFQKIANQRDDWHSKKSAYQTYKKDLISQGYSADNLYSALDQYMNTHFFSEHEKRRMKALESRLN